jgi:hypothetical protein
MKGLDLITMKVLACKWGRCNGTYVKGGTCSHCGTRWY